MSQIDKTFQINPWFQTAKFAGIIIPSFKIKCLTGLKSLATVISEEISFLDNWGFRTHALTEKNENNNKNPPTTKWHFAASWALAYQAHDIKKYLLDLNYFSGSSESIFYSPIYLKEPLSLLVQALTAEAAVTSPSGWTTCPTQLLKATSSVSPATPIQKLYFTLGDSFPESLSVSTGPPLGLASPAYQDPSQTWGSRPQSRSHPLPHGHLHLTNRLSSSGSRHALRHNALLGH